MEFEFKAELANDSYTLKIEDGNFPIIDDHGDTEYIKIFGRSSVSGHGWLNLFKLSYYVEVRCNESMREFGFNFSPAVYAVTNMLLDHYEKNYPEHPQWVKFKDRLDREIMRYKLESL